MKLLLIVIDGMSDIPVPQLGGKTPLEVAQIPNLDALARSGRTGVMYTVKKGVAPESSTGVISLLGYNPFSYPAGRGVLEAVGAGMEFKDGDLALRCDFGTVDEKMRIVDRRGGRNLTFEEGRELSEEVNREVKLESYPVNFEFRNTVSYRGILVIRSREKPLSGNMTNPDPAYSQESNLAVAKREFEMVVKDSRPLDKTDSTNVSVDLVNEFARKSHMVLEKSQVNKRREASRKLKVNYVLMRGAGSQLPKFPDINKVNGLNFASVLNMPLETGIAKLAGMKVIDLPPPSEDLEKDCELMVDTLSRNLRGYDCFYVHIKGPDEPGHDGDCKRKARLLGIIDEYFLGALKEELDMKNIVLCVTADHATPCVAKAHTEDPVPLLISGDGVVADGSKGFSERGCAKGGLGTLAKGMELMPRLMAIVKR